VSDWREEARRIVADARGRRGEEQAAEFLMADGWEILAQRVKTPRGEVDLVARRPGVVAFVEVKWRAKPEDLDLAIDQRRLTRVAAAVEIIAPRFVAAGDDWRIDVLLLAPGVPPRHIANAWMPFV
jgi:putative endonuclease